MELERASGILLHPTSFPSRYGIGDLGKEAYEFIDFLAGSGQQLWQVLPLGPTGFGNSPYLSYSALAGNHLLISPDKLVEFGLLTTEDLANFPEMPMEKVDYDRVEAVKMPLLRKAFERFAELPEDQRRPYHDFCYKHEYWVEDFAFFMALKDANGGISWHEWEEGLAKRDPKTLEEWKKHLGWEIYYHKYLQFEFYRQWQALKSYANERQIKILGDIPIYVAHDSMAVWVHQEIFCLDPETLQPSMMAGVPPDYFSEGGQLWGNPVYNWEQVEANGFDWWLHRFEGTLDYVDLLRIDHFRGFESFWAVPEGEEDARNGHWVKAPGEKFFNILRDRLGELPIVAEDLGIITDEVEALRAKFNFPGMKVLDFAFDDGPGNPYLPFNYYDRNCIVYTGTHDNDTTVGWYKKRNAQQKEIVRQYLGGISSEGIHWSMIRLALGSVANQAIIPLQDVLGLGSEARMNTPSSIGENWAWCYRRDELTDQLRDRLGMLTYLYGRSPQ
ncbi:MAG: 4-alpha-glucanotransferase [Halothece sp.]